jgi:hypothetical protein
MLELESLCLSTQSVISLSLKTLLKHVGFQLFLLNSARLLSNERFRHGVLLVWGYLCLSRISVDSIILWSSKE